MKRMESNARTFRKDAKNVAKLATELRRRSKEQLRDATKLEAAAERLRRFSQRVELIGGDLGPPMSAALKRHLKTARRRP